MEQAPENAADTRKIPDFLIRAAVTGDLHPVVIQYLAVPAVLAAAPELEADLAAHRGPWPKVSQILSVEPIRSSAFSHPTLVPLLSGFLGAVGAADFLRFARSLQRKIPDLDSHLQLLARFRSFAEAAAADRAERGSADQPTPAAAERRRGNPTSLPEAPPRPRHPAPPRRPSPPLQAIGSARPARQAPVKLWPGHTYVVRRHPAQSE